MRYLLDKNVIRYALSGLKYGGQRRLSDMEMGSLSFWKRAEEAGSELYISLASYNVLEQMRDNPNVNVLLGSMALLYPTRYHARWSRRIREITGLSREDSHIIGLATFGTDENGEIFGVNALFTYDQPMINGFNSHLTKLEARLDAMTTQLQPPFIHAKLPKILLPGS